MVQLLLKLHLCVNICVRVFCNHCNVTVVYSPENGVNNPQNHQRILNSESSGHDSGAHMQSVSQNCLIAPEEEPGPGRKARERGNGESRQGEETRGEQMRKCEKIRDGSIESDLLLK